jgi:hypothetical protein
MKEEQEFILTTDNVSQYIFLYQFNKKDALRKSLSKS